MDSLAARRVERRTGLALAVLVLIAAALALGLAWRAQDQVRRKAELITGGDAVAGKRVIVRYGCGGCHIIPGVGGANGLVGPPLSHIGRRTTIAGRLPNDPTSMTRWLRFPQSVSPGTDMPDMGLSPQQARDVAAYLYTVR